MGWSETYSYNKLTQKERREDLDKNYTWSGEKYRYTAIKSAIVHNVYYAAIKMEDAKNGDYIGTFAAVALLSKRKDGAGYWYGEKAMTEEEGPTAAECPTRILELLSEPQNEWAAEWRERCRKNAEAPNLSRLPEGTIIEFTAPYDTTYHKKGDVLQLEKCWTKYNARTGRTSYKWIERGGRIYWPQKMIPKSAVIIGG